MANDDDACVNRRGNFEIDCTLHGAPVPFLGAGCDCPRDILDNRARWIAAERREVAHKVLDVRVEAERNKALGVAAQHSMAREKAERDLAKMTFDRDAWRATAEEVRWLLQRAIAGVELRERIETALAPDQELP